MKHPAVLATLAFVVGFYLNVPVVVAGAVGLPTGNAAAFALLLAVPVVLALVVGRRPLVVTPALALMVAWLVVLVASSIAAAAEGSDGGPSAIATFLTEGLLLYLLVVNAVRSAETMRAVIWGLLIAGGAMGAISVWQEATHAYHQTLLGFAQVNDQAFKVGDTVSGKLLRPRLSGPIGEQNRYAQVLLVLVPLAVSRIRAERHLALRSLAAALGGLILAGVVLSFSRGAAVALVVLAVAMVIVGFIRLRHLLATGLALAVLVVAVVPEYALRVRSLGAADTATAQDSRADAAIRGRATENLAAFATFRDRPFLGAGPGGFFRRYSQEEANKLDMRFLGKNRRAHNMYLEIAADTGIVGLVAFLAIVGATLAQLRHVARLWAALGREDLVVLAQAFLLALVAYLASAAFLQLSYQRYFWFLLALANATAWMLRRDAARAGRDPQPPAPVRGVAVSPMPPVAGRPRPGRDGRLKESTQASTSATPTIAPPTSRSAAADCAAVSRRVRPRRATSTVASTRRVHVSAPGKRSGAGASRTIRRTSCSRIAARTDAGVALGATGMRATSSPPRSSASASPSATAGPPSPVTRMLRGAVPPSASAMRAARTSKPLVLPTGTERRQQRCPAELGQLTRRRHAAPEVLDEQQQREAGESPRHRREDGEHAPVGPDRAARRRCGVDVMELAGGRPAGAEDRWTELGCDRVGQPGRAVRGGRLGGDREQAARAVRLGAHLVEQPLHARAKSQPRAGGGHDPPAAREVRVGRRAVAGRAHGRRVARQRADEDAGARLVARFAGRRRCVGEGGEGEGAEHDHPPSPPRDERDGLQVGVVAGKATAGGVGGHPRLLAGSLGRRAPDVAPHGRCAAPSSREDCPCVQSV